jgi:hypothetical protein
MGKERRIMARRLVSSFAMATKRNYSRKEEEEEEKKKKDEKSERKEADSVIRVIRI